jgi:hypothetical protein
VTGLFPAIEKSVGNDVIPAALCWFSAATGLGGTQPPGAAFEIFIHFRSPP